MKKRIFAALLCALLLTGCGSTAEVSEDTDLTPAETIPETEAYNGLEAKDFGGAAFTIINRAKSPNYNAHPNPELEAPELTGEPLNDSIFNRNQVLEEKYNITLESVTFPQHGDIVNEMREMLHTMRPSPALPTPFRWP